jgi:rhomboid protease GluP
VGRLADRPEPARTRPCPRCGALNGAGFDRCIRCGQALSKAAASRDRLGAPINPRRLPAASVILGLNVLVFAGQLLAALSRGLVPSFLGASHVTEQVDALRFGALIASPDLVRLEPWRLLSAAFVHFGLLHVGMNMLALVHLSRVAEPAVGSARYAMTYVLSAGASFATTTVVAAATGSVPPVTAGASGAVFGIMGLILGVLVARRNPRWKHFALQAVLFSVLFGFAVNASGVGIMVNNSAHLGGLAVGFGFGRWYGRAPARSAGPRSDVWVNVGAGVCLATCVLALVLSHLSPLWREAERRWVERADSVAPSHARCEADRAADPRRAL